MKLALSGVESKVCGPVSARSRRTCCLGYSEPLVCAHAHGRHTVCVFHSPVAFEASEDIYRFPLAILGVQGLARLMLSSSVNILEASRRDLGPGPDARVTDCLQLADQTRPCLLPCRATRGLGFRCVLGHEMETPKSLPLFVSNIWPRVDSMMTTGLIRPRADAYGLANTSSPLDLWRASASNVVVQTQPMVGGAWLGRVHRT